MARKKKKTKNSTRQQIGALSLAQLIHAGKTALRNDTPQTAIDVLGFAVKKHGLLPELRSLLFQAHLSHAAQLRREGQVPAAETAAERVNPLIADVSWLNETDLIDYVSRYAGPETFDVYTRYIRLHARVPEAERQLAAHLFRHRQWALADRLDKSVPLRKEVDAVRGAVSLMDKGDWEAALEGLRGLSRKSSFAPVRLLCRAMSAFYANEDENAVKALSMIPDDFPLSGFTALLKDALQAPEDTEARQTAAARLPVLWEGGVRIGTDVRELGRCLDRGDVRESAKIMRRMAQSAFPENAQAFLTLLLQIAWKAVASKKLRPDAYLQLASSLLPETRAGSLHARMMSFAGISLIHTGLYLDQYLADDFPDAAERKIAHTVVLMQIVRQLHRHQVWEHIAPENFPTGTHRAVLGLDPDGRGIDPVGMAAKALRLDPTDREGYVLLADLPRPGRKDRNKVEAAMLTMMSEFPDDPFPCLTLASVYYENHAFRKAENILEEAMRRAPHDSRVVDKHALSLLISAQKNIRRGKFHLAGPDVERAGMVGSKENIPYISAKRSLIALIDPLTSDETLARKSRQLSLFDNKPDSSFFLDREISALLLPDRLRMLAYLLQDLESETFSQKKPVLKFLTKQLKKNLKQTKNMPSSDIIRVLAPLEKDYAAVFSHLDCAPILLKHEKKLLERIDADDITAAYEIVMSQDTFASILKDIGKRIKRAENKEKIILRFYQAAVRHLSGSSHSFDLFHDVLEDVPEGPLYEELQHISRRLSRHAVGHLRDALAHFYFGPRPGEFPFPPSRDETEDDDDFPFLDDDDEDDAWDDDLLDPDMPPLDPETIAQMLKEAASQPRHFAEMFEHLIDNMDLRDVPDSLIKEMRRIMMLKEPGMGRLFEGLARELDPAMPGINTLSREAHVFLFGKRRRKTSRKRR